MMCSHGDDQSTEESREDMTIEERVMQLESFAADVREYTRLLTETVMRMDARLDRHEQWIDELRAAQANSETKIAALADAQIRTEAALARLADAQTRTEERLNDLIDRLGNA
jgi:chromosome segregation ATPase